MIPHVLERDEIVHKRYFYLLRPLFALRWIADGRGIPPVEFSELMDTSLPEPSPVRDEIERLLVTKRDGVELSSGARLRPLHDFLVEMVGEMESLLERAQALAPSRMRPASEDLDEFFRLVVDS